MKTGALGHGARAGVATAGPIPSEGQCGMVGEMAEMHTGGTGVRFWAVEGGETYRGTCSMAAVSWSEGNDVEGVIYNSTNFV
jgi:hypothetical protein